MRTLERNPNSRDFEFDPRIPWGEIPNIIQNKERDKITINNQHSNQDLEEKHNRSMKGYINSAKKYKQWSSSMSS